MGQTLKSAVVHHPLEMRKNFFAVLAVNHAVEIVAPLRQAPRTAVTERDEIEARETAPERIAEVIGEIEQAAGYRVYNMPKLEEFFVGLRFEA